VEYLLYKELRFLAKMPGRSSAYFNLPGSFGASWKVSFGDSPKKGIVSDQGRMI
jgi:hypothetical protein